MNLLNGNRKKTSVVTPSKGNIWRSFSYCLFDLVFMSDGDQQCSWRRAIAESWKDLLGILGIAIGIGRRGVRCRTWSRQHRRCAKKCQNLCALTELAPMSLAAKKERQILRILSLPLSSSCIEVAPIARRPAPEEGVACAFQAGLYPVLAEAPTASRR